MTIASDILQVIENNEIDVIIKKGLRLRDKVLLK